MIDDKQLIRNLKKKKNIFQLKINEPSSADIVPLDEWDKPEASFINQETLLLTQIGLFKSMLKGNEKKKMNQLFNKNIPYKEEVYFNNLISKALTNYSWQWDGAINGYLRTGEDYWNSAIFIKYMDMKRYGNTKAESIKNIKAKIESIDKCFMEYAPRNQNDTKLYYRGMKNGYGFSGKGDEVIVRNFGSVSENIAVAYRFSNKVARCCIHELTIDKGIPLINMVTTTKFKGEKEILLPRDLIFKLVGFKDINLSGSNFSIRKIRVSKMRPDQFKLDTGCDKYNLCVLLPKKINKTMTSVSKDLDTTIYNSKLPRCNKGTRRNKKTGKCEKILIKKNSKSKKTICKTYHKKKPAPGCDGIPECKWVKNEGCKNK